MFDPDFNPNLHPRDLTGKFARTASGDGAAKKRAVVRHPSVTLPKHATRQRVPREVVSRSGPAPGDRSLRAHLESKIAADRTDDTNPLQVAKGDVVQIGKGQQRWKVYRIDGDIATLTGDPSHASVGGGRTQTRRVPMGKIAGVWERADGTVSNATTRKPPLKPTDIMVGGRVHHVSEIPKHVPTPEQAAAQAEARKYVNMDLKWPTRQELPRMQDRDMKEGFITAQFHGILGRDGLDTSKDKTATLDDIMAHTGLPEDRRADIKYVLTELEARGVVFGKGGHGPERGYWINKAVGSARSGGGRGRRR